MSNRLDGKKIAIFVEEGFEDIELLDPLNYLKQNGANVTVVGSGRLETFTGKKGAQITPDHSADDVDTNDFDALIIPGGHAPEKMRLSKSMVKLVAQAEDNGKIVAAICHGPQLLISAGILRDRMATCTKSIEIDVINAGAHYVDEPVVRDGYIITSRTPSDLLYFNEAIADALSPGVSIQNRTLVAGA